MRQFAKLWLGLGAALLMLAVALECAAQAPVSQNSFDAVVIKPSRMDEKGRYWSRHGNTTMIGNYPLRALILRAYGLKVTSQLIGAPEWADKEGYDITAKVSPDELKRLEALPPRESAEASRAMLREMLAERFSLRVERTTRTLPRFALERVSATGMGLGLKVTPAGPDGRAVGGQNNSQHNSAAKVSMEASGVAMSDVADTLSGMDEVGQRIVVDRTGLAGFYNFTLEYAPDNGMGVSPDATLPGLLDAMREQLGLKLVKDEGNVPVVVVKATSKPELD